MTTHPYDDIEAFALGGLDQESGDRLLDHADRCPTCAVLLAEAMRAATSLEPAGERPLSVPLNMLPPSHSHDSVVSRIYSRQNAAFWIASLVATAAAITLAIWNADLRSKTFAVPIASLVHSHFEHHALHGLSGSAKVIQALDGSWIYVVGDELTPGSTYYLWEITGGKERELGSFSANSRGQATAYWEQAPIKIQAFVVSNTQGAPRSGGDLRWP